MSYVCINRLSTQHLISGINITTTHFKSKLDFELRSQCILSVCWRDNNVDLPLLWLSCWKLRHVMRNVKSQDQWNLGLQGFNRNSIDPFKEHQSEMGCNILQRGAQEDKRPSPRYLPDKKFNQLLAQIACSALLSFRPAGCFQLKCAN